MVSYLKGIILIIALIILVTFGVKNSQPVQLNYYFNMVSAGIPVYGIVYLSIVIGIVVGMIVGIYSRLALRRTVRQLQRDINELKARVKETKGGEAEISPGPEKAVVDYSTTDMAD